MTSFYEGVNREIFEPGAVAMTNDALRQEAVGQSESSISAFKGQLAASAFFMIFGTVGVVASKIILTRMITSVTNNLTKVNNSITRLENFVGVTMFDLDGMIFARKAKA